jgi:hypothetical protein
MGDLNRAKCLLENSASVHRTFSGKYTSALEFALRERTTDYLRVLVPDTGNQVNLRDAEGRFSVDLCIEYDFAGGFKLLDLELRALNPNLVSESRQVKFRFQFVLQHHFPTWTVFYGPVAQLI